MLPLLFDYDNTYIGVLRDTESAVVDWRLNGEHNLTVKYHVTEPLHNLVKCGQVLRVVPYLNGEIDSYEITSIDEDINGAVTLTASQIAHRLRHGYLGSFTATTPQELMTGLSGAATGILSDFTFTSTVTAAGNLSITTPRSIKDLLFSELIQTFGGELDIKGTTVTHVNRLGQDRGAVIRYGYNATDYTVTKTRETSYNAILPYWSKDGNTVIGSIVSFPSASVSDYTRPLPVDFTESFDTAPTQATLETAAAAVFDANADIWNEGITAALSYIDLSETLNYKGIINDREDIRPGDTVSLIIGREGKHGGIAYLKVSRRIVGTSWDVLTGRYLSLQFADPLTTELSDGSITGSIQTDTGYNDDGTPKTASDLLAEIGMGGDSDDSGGGGSSDFRIEDGTPIFEAGGTTHYARFGIRKPTTSFVYPSIGLFYTEGPSYSEDAAAVHLSSLYATLQGPNNNGTTGATVKAGKQDVKVNATDQIDLNAGSAYVRVNNSPSVDIQGGDILYLRGDKINIWGASNTSGYGKMTKYIRSGADYFEVEFVADKVIIHNLSQASDRRLKTDIHALTDAAWSALFDSLSPVSYEFRNKPGATRIGLIAQDVERAEQDAGVDPNFTLVSENEKGIKNLNYIELIPLLIREVQILKEEIKNLKKETK